MICLLDKSLCCGCGACRSICPKHCIGMKEDAEGFLYPEIDTVNCVDCGLCEKVCPVRNQAESKWPSKVYAAVNSNEDVRRYSSSGGVFTVLAEKILSEGGVVFGARFNEHWDVIHDYCETLVGLAAFRGSKYVQSDMGDCYRLAEIFLKKGRKVLFSGVSCQIAGLHRFLRKEYENLLTVDVICHGVPSPLVWRKYVEAIQACPLGIAGGKWILSSLNEIPVITSITFRDKSTGWKKYSFSVRGHAGGQEELNTVFPPRTTKDEIIFREIHHENLFMDGFLKNVYLRPSCYACPAKSGKAKSDITLGDFWGIENVIPKFDDDGGCSVVLLYKSELLPLLGGVRIEEVAYEEVRWGNPALEKSATCSVNRNYFFYLLDKEKNLGNIYHLCFDASLMQRIRRFIFRKYGA